MQRVRDRVLCNSVLQIARDAYRSLSIIARKFLEHVVEEIEVYSARIYPRKTVIEAASLRKVSVHRFYWRYLNKIEKRGKSMSLCF